MTKNTVMQAVTKIFEELKDFSQEERRRIVQASLTLLGDSATNLEDKLEDPNLNSNSPAKARQWLKQSGLTPEQINEVFHIDDNGVEVIASIPGATRRDQVRNAYVLSGVAQLLFKGETKFDDKAARSLCESGGFFDSTNHAKYMKGSEFTGSKEKGWVLTSPGLRHAVNLITELTKQ